VDKTQREYYVNEQMKAIQKELGDEEGRNEFAEIEGKIRKAKLSNRPSKGHELKKLRRMSPMSMPWRKNSKIKKDRWTAVSDKSNSGSRTSGVSGGASPAALSGPPSASPWC
jgi:hypothetical protein